MNQRTKIDWLGGRSRCQVEDLAPRLAPMFGSLSRYLRLSSRGSGTMGFESSADVFVADARVGLAAWGGANQKGWVHVSLTGGGCDLVSDWSVAQECLDTLDAWEPRRVDIALDTFCRESSHEHVLAGYRSGQFTTSGRAPKMSMITSDDRRDGRTVYIGSRQGTKFVRCYEKGLQLALAGQTHIDGVAVEDWYRVELELKAKEGPLPVDIIDRRDQYLAGSYPYMQQLLGDVEPEILVSTRERVPQLELARALQQIRTQYGRTLFTALHAYEGDIGAVWSKVCGDQHQKDLLEAGVLLVDHV